MRWTSWCKTFSSFSNKWIDFWKQTVVTMIGKTPASCIGIPDLTLGSDSWYHFLGIQTLEDSGDGSNRFRNTHMRNLCWVPAVALILSDTVWTRVLQLKQHMGALSLHNTPTRLSSALHVCHSRYLSASPINKLKIWKLEKYYAKCCFWLRKISFLPK